MTALSAASVYRQSWAETIRGPFPVKLAANAVVYPGSLVMIKSDGYGAAAAASASNKGCVGVATEEVDNTGGSDGDVTVMVNEGVFRFAADTIAIGTVGTKVYADDDNTVDETQATDCPVAGLLRKVDSASSCWVEVSAALAATL